MKRHTIYWYAALVWLTAGALTCRGQERDYTQGFEHFYKLGLPRTANARLVEIRSLSEYRHSWRNPTECVWLLREDDEKAVLLMNHRHVEVWRQKAKDGSKRLHGVWVDSDPQNEFHRIRQRLQSIGKHHEVSRVDTSVWVPFFLHCAYLADAGHKDLANTLLKEIFAQTTQPRDLIGAALDTLANARYEDALDTLARTADWKAFRDTLAGLRRDFGRQWKAEAGVAILQKKVEARIEHGVPEPSGADLGPEHRALARELAETPAKSLFDDHAHPTTLWILPSVAGKIAREEIKTPLNRIAAMGVEALPLLAALVGDETLVPFRRSAHEFYGGMHPYDSGHEIYETMIKPATRGGLTSQFFSALWPNDLLADDKAVLKTQINELAAALRGKSENEILRFYLRHDSETMRIQGLDASHDLPITNDNAADIEAALFRFVLDDPHDFDWRQFQARSSVSFYIARRGRAALPFIEKIASQLKTALAAFDRPAPAAKESKGRPEADLFVSEDREERNADELAKSKAAIEKMIREIELALSDQPFEELVKDIASAKIDVSQTAFVNALYAQTDEATRLHVVLQQAIAARNVDERARLLRFAAELLDRVEDNREDKPYEPATHRELWEDLLTDKRIASSPFSSPDSIATLAAMVLKDDAIGNLPHDLIDSLPFPRAKTLLVAHAHSRLAGKSGDATPSTLPPSDPTRNTDLAARLQAAPDAELAAFVTALTDAEYLNLAKMAPSDATIQKRFLPSSRRIGKIEKEIFGLKTGEPLTVKSLKEIVQRLREAAGKGQQTGIAIQREDPMSGFTVAVISPPDYSEPDWADYIFRGSGDGKSSLQSATGAILFSGHRFITKATWPTIMDAAQPSQEVQHKEYWRQEVEEEFWQEVEEEFWQKIEEALDTPFRRIHLSFLVRPAQSRQ